MPPRNRCAPGVKKGKNGSCLPVAPAPGCRGDDLCTAKALGRRDLLARLRPEKPASWLANPKTWLDTNNIDAVMRQYERPHPHFKYLSTLPIDAFERKRDGACVSRFCDMSVRELLAGGKTLVGMIMNLDRHDQPGSHWVMAALNMRDPARPELYYYDSFGKRPPKEMKAQFARIAAQFASAAARQHALTRSACNRRQHQRNNTECGPLSMLALEHLIKGGCFFEYCASDVADAHGFAARDVMFSGPPAKEPKGLLERLFPSR